MPQFNFSGEVFSFPEPFPELESFKAKQGISQESEKEVLAGFVDQSFYCESEGWVAGENRRVRVCSYPPDILLDVDGGSEFYISPGGESIEKMVDSQVTGRKVFPAVLTEFDRQIILGPALVLALALRGVWSLHASAAVFKDHSFAFVGESGQGKSTLAAYLANKGVQGWRLLADDILPAKIIDDKMTALPHFPQLKLSPDAQPGINWPEQVPLNSICILSNSEEEPSIRKLPLPLAIQVLLGHTAGTRLFPPQILKNHLDFCAQAASCVSVYSLAYPRVMESLPKVKSLLEGIV